MHSFEQRLQAINDKITAASLRSEYQQRVKLIAVTKTHPPETLQLAYQHGLSVFGENRVQELLAKKPVLPENIEWHLIGALQTNKVKSVLPHIKLIHSLDREALSDELDKRGAQLSLSVNALIEVNIAEEENKHGIHVNEISDFLHYLSFKKNVNVTGLMTVAPYTDKPEEIRWVFKSLRRLFLHIKNLNIPNVNMQWLSMGMTNDFEIAIEEGSNLVRIGSGIFGAR